MVHLIKQYYTSNYNTNMKRKKFHLITFIHHLPSLSKTLNKSYGLDILLGTTGNHSLNTSKYNIFNPEGDMWAPTCEAMSLDNIPSIFGQSISSIGKVLWFPLGKSRLAGAMQPWNHKTGAHGVRKFVHFVVGVIINLTVEKKKWARLNLREQIKRCVAQAEPTKNGKGQQHTDEDSRNISVFTPALSEIKTFLGMDPWVLLAFVIMNFPKSQSGTYSRKAEPVLVLLFKSTTVVCLPWCLATWTSKINATKAHTPEFTFYQVVPNILCMYFAEIGCVCFWLCSLAYLWLSSSRYLLDRLIFISRALILLFSLIKTLSFWLEPCTAPPFNNIPLPFAAPVLDSPLFCSSA